MPKRRRRKATTDALLKRVYRSAAYRGKHVVVVGGKVYAASSGKELARLYERVVKEFPADKPTLAYVPRADVIIVMLR